MRLVARMWRLLAILPKSRLIASKQHYKSENAKMASKKRQKSVKKKNGESWQLFGN